jgi:predicted permease
MKTLRAMFVRLAGLFRRKRHEAEMNEELRAHLEGLIERNLAAGMPVEQARYAALREFGGVEQIKERARDERRSLWGEHLLQDLRYATRQLRKSPGFTAVIVLSLALGIGANSAIFTVIDALLLRSLPVPEPERLVIVGGDGTFARFEQLRAELTSLSELCAIGSSRRRPMVATDRGLGEAESVALQEVSGSFFAVLGETALVGRTFTPADDKPGATRPVVVLSHAYWQRRFNADPSVLGREVIVSNVVVAIVGVMPPGFFGVDVGQARSVEAWCPLWLKTQLDDGFEAERLTTYATGSHWLDLMGRLKPGIDLAQARAELAAISPRLGPLRPDDEPPQLTLRAGGTGFSRMRGAFRQPLNILWAIAGLVLLVACANVGGLLLARGATRQREFAVRLAMGAGRGRIVRQLATESLLLALLGGAAGLVLASWGATWLGRYVAGSALDLAVDQRVLLFTTIVSAATGVLFGLAPALRFSRLDLTTAFNTSATTLAGRGRQRLNRALVVAQIALSFVLLAGAGLFVRTLQNLRAHDPGFAREQGLQFTLDLGRARTNQQRVEVYRRVLAEMETLPGVRSATVGTGGLLGSSNSWNAFTIDNVEVANGRGRGVLALTGSRRYFETKGTPILRGRDFAIQDDEPGARPVALISETIARKYFPDADPIGRQIRRAPKDDYEIIGVVRDAQVRGFREAAEPVIYLPYFQVPDRWDATAEVSVRTTGDPLALTPSLRTALKRIDPQAGITGLGTVRQLLEQRFTRERALAELAGFFSVLTLVLAGVGLYGVLAYGVAQRTREIGLRMALGAPLRAVLSLVIGQGVRLAVVGCGLGAIGALVLTRFIASLLYGVDTHDRLVLGAAALALLIAALLACWLPAQRATKVDPMVALRAE